jgi:plasmid stabilization system protein ParE
MNPVTYGKLLGMSLFRLSPEAARDLTEIYEYIAKDNLSSHPS